MAMHKRYAYYTGVGFVGVAGFVIVSHLAQMHSALLSAVIDQASVAGVIVYIASLALAVVVAPISTGFLLPIAANSWGPLPAGVYSMVGWSLGAAGAFYIARRFGAPFVKRFAPIEKLQSMADVISTRHMFVSVLLFRLSLPVEVMSYVVGLFTTMRFGPYMLATVIGIAPFTFLISYASVGSVTYQVIVALLAVVSFSVGVWYVRRAYRVR